MGAIVEAGSVLGFGGYGGKQYYEDGDLIRMLNPLAEKKRPKVPDSTFKLFRYVPPVPHFGPGHVCLTCRIGTLVRSSFSHPHPKIGTYSKLGPTPTK
jgi:hypothetical protein